MVQLRAALPLNAPVELILPLREGTRTRSYRLPAIVTRCGESGVGLMFGRIESEMWSALLAQIKPQTVPNAEEIGGVGSGSVPVSSRS